MRHEAGAIGAMCALALMVCSLAAPTLTLAQDSDSRVVTQGLKPPPKRPAPRLQAPPKRPSNTAMTPPPKRPAPAAVTAPPKRPDSAPASAPAPTRSDSPIAVHRVAAKLRAENAGLSSQLRQREAKFKERLDQARGRVSGAKQKLARLEAQGRAFEQRFDRNKVTLDNKTQLLADKIGALKELFGVFQQNASDLIGAFNGSPTSVQYPDRDVWLEGFANRMRNASEVSSTDDIRTLWFEVLREIEARGNIVRLSAPVYPFTPEPKDPKTPIDLGTPQTRELVRVGGFDLVSAAPQAEYLQWKAGRQHVAQLERQPVGPYLPLLGDFVGSGGADLAKLSVDPTGGTLTELLAAKPTRPEQAAQGGLVGYIIIGLGALAFLLAAFKLLDIAQINLRVEAQRRRLDRPGRLNPLGRLLQVYADNRTVDSEVLALRLDDRYNKEVDRIQLFTAFLVIIALVAPLLGLLGTVVGMIKTFQAITLYGTGDPQTMAGGISQALITTVLGLIVAVPAVLMNALVSSRAKAVIEILAQQKALLLGDRIEAEHKAEAAPLVGADPLPNPA